MTTALKHPRYSSDKFAWKMNTGTAEASELGGFDSNKGLTIVSGRTGKEIFFVKIGTDTDASGEDVYGWRFAATTSGYKHLTLLIIND